MKKKINPMVVQICCKLVLNYFSSFNSELADVLDYFCDSLFDNQEFVVGTFNFYKVEILNLIQD